MIAGLLEGSTLALRRSPAVLEILRVAADPALLAAPLGRHAIAGERLFYVLSEYETHPPAGSLPETHAEFCDVQLVLSGEERIGWAPLSAAFVPRGEGDPAQDVRFYAPAEGMSWLVASPGRFFLFDPADVHQPGVAVDAPRRVRKLVGKVHRSLLDF